jgi:AraC-like DNA-binding protein
MDSAILDFALRCSATTLLVLLGFLFARQWRQALAARLGLALCITIIFYLVSASPVYVAARSWLKFVVPVFSMSVVPVFWLFTSAWFDDDFTITRKHLAIWAAYLVFGILHLIIGVQISVFAQPVMAPVYHGFSIVIVCAALWIAWQGRESDLVEMRRRVRGFFVVAIGIYILIVLLGETVFFWSPQFAAFTLIMAAGVLVLTLAFMASLLGLRHAEMFPHYPPTDAPSAPAADPQPLDEGLAARLAHLMISERLYRQDGLTIGMVAHTLAVPEYKLRRLINQNLGHRNFNSFLNQYRLAETREALADPAQTDVPVLTIALDAGFGSLAPFNRAFKADTGMTPSDYRRLHAVAI